MKLNVNGDLIDATPEQEAEILAYQAAINLDFNRYKELLQQAIDQKASEKEYASGFSCASYISSTNAQWAAESQAFVAWRDNCFEYGYDYFNRVGTGEIQNPTTEHFIAGLPVMNWPQL